ncbi:MAG: ATPase [Fluviicola sp.]|nr:MAG: ATPase [Fluviicola sp.]
MNGEKAKFDQSKLRTSLERSGANNLVVQKVIDEVKALLYEGMTTKEIYKTAFKLLRKSSRPTAAKYKLKNAILELGPTGFPFEKFVGKILEYENFKTKVGVIVKGHCVNHEVDVVAKKENKHFMVECKFHSEQGRKCNVKIPLYIQSRFIDVEKQWSKKDGHETKFHQGWIYTNTRFTSDAIRYGTCAGLMLVGWDYPKVDSLKERIDLSGLHPITSLTTLTKDEKQKLLSKENVLCMELCNQPELLKSIGVSQRRQKNILSEAHQLCGI